MPANKAEMLLQAAPVLQIKLFEKNAREIKSAQRIGIDNVSCRIATDNVGYNVTLDPNEFLPAWTTLVFTSEKGPRTINFAQRLRVDADDPNHEWPHGSSLSAAQKDNTKVAVMDYLGASDDYIENETTGNRSYHFRISNRDSVPHTYYVRSKAYIITFPGGF